MQLHLDIIGTDFTFTFDFTFERLLQSLSSNRVTVKRLDLSFIDFHQFLINYCNVGDTLF